MSTLGALKSNLNVAKTLIVDGRDRYLGVTKVAIAIEQIYRLQRNKAKLLPDNDSRQLLSQAHTESAEKICALCKENGAIWVKFGQFLSCRPDILPLEYLKVLQTLQNSSRIDPLNYLPSCQNLLYQPTYLLDLKSQKELQVLKLASLIRR